MIFLLLSEAVLAALRILHLGCLMLDVHHHQPALQADVRTSAHCANIPMPEGSSTTSGRRMVQFMAWDRLPVSVFWTWPS